MMLFRSIIPFVFIGIAIAGGIFFVWPRYQQFGEIQSAITQQEQRIERGEEVLVKLRDLKKQVESRSKEFKKIEDAIAEETALPGTYHEMQKMSTTSGLILTGINSATEILEEDDVQFEKTLLSFQFQGFYEGVKQFLSQVRASAQILNVQSITIDTDAQAEGVLSLQIDVESYAVSINKEL